jgi:serine/threonine-protein kinase ULK/ATG1
LNPYDEFKDINYDFNKFYEDNENLGEKEVLDRVAKLQTK